MGKKGKKKTLKAPKMMSEKDIRKTHNNYQVEQVEKHMKKRDREEREKDESERAAKQGKKALEFREEPNSALFFSHNVQLKPPYQVLLDTNFINFCIANKHEVVQALMNCLMAKVIPCVTDCVIGELEKLGERYKFALRVAKDPRFRRLTCMHTGTYADDCIVRRVEQHRCYIVGTNDRDLKRRIRKIPGVPICTVQGHKGILIEKLPEVSW